MIRTPISSKAVEVGIILMTGSYSSTIESEQVLKKRKHLQYEKIQFWCYLERSLYSIWKYSTMTFRVTFE
jgi:hypothetical protein